MKSNINLPHWCVSHGCCGCSPGLSRRQFLKECGATAALGWGAVPAAFAALWSDLVVQVTLKHALTSYADIAESEDYTWPLSSLLPGVLARFDLPDCYRELRNLRQIDPWGANSTEPRTAP